MVARAFLAPHRRHLDMKGLDASEVSSWGSQALWELMSPFLPGLAVEVVESLRSTNDELVNRLRLAARNARGRDGRADDVHPSLLVAVRQTQGRGRLGREWISRPHRSLTFSLSAPLLRPDWSGLSLAVGVAVARTLDPSGRWLRLKWPNDLWLSDADGGGRKLGGVLIEAMSVGEHRVAVIGVGLNVKPPEQLASVASISEFLPEATPMSVLADVGPALASMLVEFDRHGFACVQADFEARDLLAGLCVSTTDPACPEGVAQGLDRDGALRVLHNEVMHRIISGEVSVRPVASHGSPQPD